MVPRSLKLDIHQVNTMSHAELVSRLIAFRHGFPPMILNRNWLEKQSTAQLRIVLMAAQLYRVCLARGRAKRVGSFSRN
jgi:hypothetical protein